MHPSGFLGSPRVRLFVPLLLAGLLAAGLLVTPANAAPEQQPEPQPGVTEGRVTSVRGLATKAYVEEFWPLWLSYEQWKIGGSNRLVGPDKTSAVYKVITTINDDTFYGGGFVDLKTGSGGSDEPVIVTVPAAGSDLSYSVLTLDGFGTVLEDGIPSKASGTASEETVYALVPKGYAGSIPTGAIEIEMPIDFFFQIFRVDRYTGDDNKDEEAATFRANLRLQTLTDYQNDASGGAMDIVPEAAFAEPLKVIADTLVQDFSIAYLTALQEAVKASNTPPLTARELAIAAEFDNLFGDGGSKVTPLNRVEFTRGARAGHDAIVANYLDNRDDNNWIHFTNVGEWENDEALDRASVAEFIQWANNISAAAYYHAFLDGDGDALTGADGNVYVLTFPADEEPPHERFWSVTAYTPDSISFIDNPIDKYLVASYTPNLATNDDGSLSIYMSETQPEGVPEANWLPVSGEDFNVVLRVYGVPADSDVADNTYRPPPVQRQTSFTTLDASARVLDTRAGQSTVDGQYAGGGQIVAGTSVEIPIAGRGGVPSSGVDAVVVNATAANAVERGYVTIHPCGERPLASSLNYPSDGSAVANEIVAELSDSGSLCAYAHTTTDLVLDAVGYVADTSTHTPLGAARLLETRAGEATIDGQSAGGGPIPGGSFVEVPVRGRGGVPTDGVDAVVLNATATNGAQSGFATIYPCGERPLASSLNYQAGASAVASEVIAELSDDGSICVYAHTTTDFVLDAVGYLPSTPTYLSIDAARLLETRAGEDTIDGRSEGGGQIPGGSFVEVPVLGRGGVPSSDVDAVVLNATATNGANSGFVTIYPCGERPLASSLNHGAGGAAVANEVIAAVSDAGSICAYAHSTIDLVFDVVGYVPSV